MPKTPFNQSELDAKWNRFCYQIKESGRDTLYLSLTRRKPLIKNSFVIEYILDNKAQADYVSQIKSEFIDFLRKELDNYSLNLEFIVQEVIEEKMLYTGKDKFDKMVESNPHLLKLQQALKLLIE